MQGAPGSDPTCLFFFFFVFHFSAIRPDMFTLIHLGAHVKRKLLNPRIRVRTRIRASKSAPLFIRYTSRARKLFFVFSGNGFFHGCMFAVESCAWKVCFMEALSRSSLRLCKIFFGFVTWVLILVASSACRLQNVASDCAETFNLECVRESLIRQEDTIVFSLIERAKFSRNLKVYDESWREISGFSGSLFQLFVKEAEVLQSKVILFFLSFFLVYYWFFFF